MSDLIDRDEAIKTIILHNGVVDKSVAKRLLILLQMKSEEPRKKGKWLRSGSAIFPYECDQCGDTTERNTPFCPHCGADMREGEEE